MRRWGWCWARWAWRAARAALAAALLWPAAAPAAAGPAAGAAAQRALIPGAVVSLNGTPHLWVADTLGVLHWAGDSRALAGRRADWGSRLSVPLAQLKQYPIGDPWLSAGLLKLGDPIYLVKWESVEAAPQLLHIQSLEDVELFGINGANYGSLVLEREPWERRYGLAIDALPRGALSAATGGRGSAPRLVVPVQGILAGRGTSAATSWVVGQVRNDGGDACGFSVQVTLMDAQGTIVTARSMDMRWVRLAGSEQAPFELAFIPLPRFTHYDVRATPADRPGTCPYVRLGVGPVNVEEAAAGATTFRARGTIANDSGARLSRVRLVAAFYDRDGNLVDVVGANDTGYTVLAAPVEPGQRVAFDVPSASSATNWRVAGITTARIIAVGDVN